jgi:hypothetical protein
MGGAGSEISARRTLADEECIKVSQHSLHRTARLVSTLFQHGRQQRSHSPGK